MDEEDILLDPPLTRLAAPLRGGEMAASSDVPTQEEVDQLAVSPFSVAVMLTCLSLFMY